MLLKPQGRLTGFVCAACLIFAGEYWPLCYKQGPVQFSTRKLRRVYQQTFLKQDCAIYREYIYLALILFFSAGTFQREYSRYLSALSIIMPVMLNVIDSLGLNFIQLLNCQWDFYSIHLLCSCCPQSIIRKIQA